MTLRKNIITLVVWSGILVVFAMHIILTRQNEQQTVNLYKKDMYTNDGKNVNIDIPKKGDEIKDEKSFIDSLKGFFDFPYGHTSTTTKRVIIEPIQKDLYRGEDVQDVNKTERESHEPETRRLQIEIGNLKLEIDKLKKQEALNPFTHTSKTNIVRSNLPVFNPRMPWVFAITPTYARYTQKADLTRLSQTLLLVPNLHWIIIEDSNKNTDLVKKLLRKSSLSFTLLYGRTPSYLQRKKGERYNRHHRGVLQRNLALEWIKDNIDLTKTPGVLYFMDDDNTYDLKLFEELRWTKRVSMWPVAFTGGLKWAGPILFNGKFMRFRTDWALDRKFPIDMAGFSVNIKYWLHYKHDVRFNITAKRGYMETNFLERMITTGSVEYLADNCTKVLVWHTRTEVPKLNMKGEKKYLKMTNRTNVPDIEV